MVRLLLDAGANANARSQISGNTALFLAAYRGRMDVVKLLVEHGADVNAKDDGDSTPLQDAAWSGQTEVVRYLLEQGAEPDAKDGFGRSALDLAIEGGHTEIATILEEAGATTRPADAEPMGMIASPPTGHQP